MSQFEQGWQPKVSHQDLPGSQDELPHEALEEYLPGSDGKPALYLAAGKLKGKNALITGGDSGIGRATGILFAMEGVSQIMISHLPEEKKDAESAKEKMEKLSKGQTKVHTFEADLTDRAVCKKLAETAVSTMGSVNILFNNAAFQQMVQDPIKDLSEDQWVKTFNTNIHPFFFLAKYLVPQMKPGDTIINNASINAYIGRPDLLDYTSTKGAIVSFTRGLANSLVTTGIRVNAVAPGPVWTPLIPATMDDDAQKEFTAPIGRPSQPSEIATCVVFLASNDSSSVVGQVIHCNGGGFTTS